MNGPAVTLRAARALPEVRSLVDNECRLWMEELEHFHPNLVWRRSAGVVIPPLKKGAVQWWAQPQPRVGQGREEARLDRVTSLPSQGPAEEAQGASSAFVTLVCLPGLASHPPSRRE